MIKLIILILRRCFARSSLPLRTNASVFSFRVLSPAETESSTDNSEDEVNSTDNSEDDSSVKNSTGLLTKNTHSFFNFYNNQGKHLLFR